MKDPNLFIVGAPKSGTTSLFHYLGQHPDVHAPTVKEPHFLADDLNWMDGWGIEDESVYKALFEESKKINIDASVWYLYSDAARQAIAKNYPEAKVIICLRHPVNFMESMWWHMYSRGKDTSKTLLEALDKEIAVKEGADFRPAPFRKSILYREAASFHDYVERYFNDLGQHRIKVVLLEDIANDLEGTLRSIYSFLGLNYIEPEDRSIKNPAGDREFIRLKRMAKKYDVLHRILYSQKNKNIRFWVKNKWHILVSERQKKRRQLCDVNWQSFNREFEGNIKNLSKLIKRNLNHWLREKKRNI